MIVWLTPRTQETEMMMLIEKQAAELRELKDVVRTLAEMKLTEDAAAPLQCVNEP